MKKSLVSIILLGLLGIFLGSQAIAWNQNHMPQRNMGQMNNQNMQQRSGNYRQFMQESISLRLKIAQDRSQLQTLMARENPDQQKVQQLRSRIGNNINKLQEMANSHNVPMQNRNNQMHRRYHGNGNYHMMGNCWGHNRGGYGHGCGGCW